MAQRSAPVLAPRRPREPDGVDVAAVAALIPDAPLGVRGTREEIAAAVATIVARVDPEQVVLFGSRAYGTATPDSDIDLMVVSETPFERWVLGGDLPGPDVRSNASFHLHRRRPHQIALGLAEGDFFIQDVMLKGIPLHDTGRFRVSTKDEGARQGERVGPTQATLGWVKKAESDLRVARIVVEGSDDEADAVCFHAQQATEKYLKALLQGRDIRHSRTHDLAVLGDLAVASIPDLGRFREDFRWLSLFAVDSRYPDAVEEPVPDAARAIGIATEVRGLVRAALGVDG